MQAPDAEPRAVYRRRLASRRADLSARRRADARLSLLRLLVFLGAAALVWPVVMTRALSWTWMIVPAVAFAAVAWAHDRVIRSRTAAGRAVRFYEAGLARIDDRWAGSGIQGTAYLDPEHPYADDLDLFGPGSLFELICTARTRTGERTLARWLLDAAPPDEIRQRQEAVRELQTALDLREDLARLGEDVRADDDPDALAAWAGAAPVLAARWPVWLGAVLAAGNVAAGIGWLWGATGRWPLVVVVAASLAFTLGFRSRVRRVLGGASRPQHELELLAGVLARLERERFRSPRLRSLRTALEADGPVASRRIARLARLVELNDSRRNMIFAPIAATLLLGTQLAFALERWRAATGGAVARWLDAVGQIESLCAIAALAYERPEDVFPEIVEGGPRLEGEELGHPLLPRTVCVRNDIALGSPARLLLVSGSNMSGKSTLLRTVGVLSVLAQAGAPVRARRLSLSPLAVGACLNVRDSLRHGMSHFYAEIRRLRSIVDLGGARRPLLFLLDEILHGTNSHDRRIGAEAVIQELLHRGGIGLVTTHDLALAAIVDALGAQAANVHFEDRIEDGRISFDYRLRPGVVRKSNALELMRRVGLNV
jgi:ABC-type transport system involved in cytochrome c biogenesis ATPase subunit